MVHKVVPQPTGNVGAQSVHALATKPRFGIVGGRIYDAGNADTDIGALCGVQPLRVATTKSHEIIALTADCPVFNILGNSEATARCLDKVCPLLESGNNVVSGQSIHASIRRPSTASLPPAACAPRQRKSKARLQAPFGAGCFPAAAMAAARDGA